MTTTKFLHFRRLAPFGPNIGNWIDEQFEVAHQLFKTRASIDLVLVTNMLKSFNEGIVKVDDCLMGASGTNEQADLFASIPDVPATLDDIVVFVAVDFSEWKGGGCAWHPPGRPGCMVTKGKLGAHVHKLAHELGHVLELPHQDLSSLLMYPSVAWSVMPPLLSQPEIDFLEGRGPPLRPAPDGSLALSDGAYRFELSRIEPRYREFRRHGERALPLLSRVYETTDDAEYRARALHAMSVVARSYDDFGGLLDRAAVAEGSDRTIERRAAADAAGKLLPLDQAERILGRLQLDEDAGVRFLADRYLRKESQGRFDR